MICQAIQNRHLISFSYKGRSRTVEPYTVGVTSTGKECLRAYQVGGGSNSGDSTDWKLFHVREMHMVQELSESFSPRHGYNRGDPAFERIICQV